MFATKSLTIFVSAGCTRWLGGPAALVSDESALEVWIRDDALYKLTIFTFTFHLLAL